MTNHKAVQYGRYFDEFEVGDVYEHALRKTITESDNNLFSLITMNHHPLHLDQEYVKDQQHGRVLVVGTLVFSLVVGLTVADVSGRAIANLGYHEIRHSGPVFIGDTLHAKTEVLNVRKSKSKPDRGVVSVKTIAYNQREEEVLEFSRDVLVPVLKP
ncbi:MAG: MaoC family dehydratase [Bacteroidetes bacterium]|nr:MaoC family dehydratase [Bacteroidota bacterium]